MRLRTFNAPDMNSAMQMIRSTLGEDAVIISSDASISGNGIIVTAAAHNDEPKPPSIQYLHSANFTSDAVIADLEETLKFHSTPDYVISRLLDTARHLCLQGKDKYIDMTRLTAASFQFQPFPLDQDIFNIMLVGAPGTGKTMTIAKIASQIVMDKHKPVVITTDNKRAGGVEQLSAFTTILGLKLHVADNRGELWRLLQQYSGKTRVLIDTGGVNPYNLTDLRELSEYIKLDKKIEPVLVVAAGSDSAEAGDMAEAFAPLGVKRMLVTRIDAARRYGSVLTAAHVGKLSFSYASNSSRIVGEFTDLNPSTIANMILLYKDI